MTESTDDLPAEARTTETVRIGKAGSAWFVGEHQAVEVRAFLACDRPEAAGLFCVPVALRAEADLERVQQAFRDVLLRHPEARVTFHEQDGRVAALPRSLAQMKWEPRTLEEPASPASIETLASELMAEGLAPSQVPHRFVAVRAKRGDARHERYVLWVGQSAVLDTASIEIVWREVLAACEGGTPAHAQRSTSLELAARERYLARRNSARLDTVFGPNGRAPQAVPVAAVATHVTEGVLPSTARLEAASARFEVPPQILLQGALALVLALRGGPAAWSVVTSVRREEDRASLGVFTANVPLAINVDARGDLVTWLRELEHQQSARAALADAWPLAATPRVRFVDRIALASPVSWASGPRPSLVSNSSRAPLLPGMPWVTTIGPEVHTAAPLFTCFGDDESFGPTFAAILERIVSAPLGTALGLLWRT